MYASFFAEKTWTEEENISLLNDLIQLSHHYHVSKKDLFEKIFDLLGTKPKEEKEAKEEKTSSPRRGAKWTKEEEDTMLSMLAQGANLSTIASRLDRTNNGVLGHLVVWELSQNAEILAEEILKKHSLKLKKYEKENFDHYFQQQKTTRSSKEGKRWVRT